ncbi:MAG TPA: hypothetical protein VGQ99_19245 [Tepidisphaeraceae bacterium]|jgi:hypothetical protein|nr:hypothetical protein [Tepidisphaeraceae bacterium]
MKNWARFDERAGMDVGARLDKRRGMDMGAGLDERLGRRVRGGGGGGLVGSADGLPQHAHELEVERGGDEIDGGGDSHAGG